MKKIRGRRLLSVVFLALVSPAPALASDAILLHGHIYTGNPRMPWAEALAVTGTRIEAVGSDRDISRHRHAITRVIDLHGRTVIPGIVDSHIHVLYGAYA